jgi:hypothetical protein
MTSSTTPLLVSDVYCTFSQLHGDILPRFGPARSSSVAQQTTDVGGLSPFLLPEVRQHILCYLLVEPIRPSEVTVTGCSSHDNAHSPAHCLDDSPLSWWMSAPQSMPQGRGREYVQFRLGPCPRRLTMFGIKIPPLPQGPLSVFEFCLEVPRAPLRQADLEGEEKGDSREWIPITPVLSTSNHAHMQWFDISFARRRLIESMEGMIPRKIVSDESMLYQVDAQDIRLVCLSNMVSPHVQNFLSVIDRSVGDPGLQWYHNLRHDQGQFNQVGFLTAQFR